MDQHGFCPITSYIISIYLNFIREDVEEWIFY